MHTKRYICSECIEEDYLSQFINLNGELRLCSFCYKDTITIDFELIIEIILDGIEFIYDDPANGLGYVDREYVKGNGDIVDTFDLLIEEFGMGGSKAFEDILDNLPIQLWCKKEFYGLDSAQEMIYTWDYFVNQVKYKTRYFFVQEKTSISEHLPYESPVDILDDLASAVRKFNLIDILKEGEIIYRARLNDKMKYKTPEELGTPKPDDCLKANRMSPAGIPMFYGSATKETCLLELRKIEGNYTIGKWTPTKDLMILNLTKYFDFDKGINKYIYPDFPSVFDKTRRDDIFNYLFILKFASDLSGTVDEKVANINYVPTQIAAEYLRKIALFDGKHLDGICFYSSIDGGINYSLFIEHEECIKSDKWNFNEQKIELLETEEIEIKSA